MNSIAGQFESRRFTRQIGALRSRLRLWLTVRGLGRILWILLAVLCLDMAVDRWFRMDGAQRGILLVLFGGTAVWLVWRNLLKPVSRRISDDALVLEVERRNPQLAQSVITGFQLLKGLEAGRSGGSAELVAAAIGEGLEKSSTVVFPEVLDRAAAGRNVWLLVSALAVAAGLGVGVAGNGFLNTWFRRNLMVSSDEWPRSTILEIVGAEEGRIVVPRGMDYRLVVEVDGSSRIQTVDVDLEIDSGTSRGQQRMKPTGKLGGREHAFVFPGIAAECRIRAIGGDDVTDWVSLVLVEPPAVEDLQLVAVLPQWTGRERVPLSGTGPHSLLEGSGLDLTAVVNKPLRSAELSGSGLSLPLLPELDGGLEYRAAIARGEGGSGGVAGASYAVRLTDELGLANVRDYEFELRVRENAIPLLRMKLLGISGLAVPNAHLPVEYSGSDDYGISTLELETRWLDETTQVGAKKLPVAGFSGDRTKMEIGETVSVLELEPLGLRAGQTLRFVGVATDYAEPEAGKGLSREFLLRIVTPEELLSDLLRREIEQRGVFQQAYDRQLELNSLLLQVAADGGTGVPLSELESRWLALYRTQRGIGTAVNAVADRFDGFLVEVANNRLDEESAAVDPGQTIQGRFENEIVRPIRELDGILVSEAVRGIENARRFAGKPEELAPVVAAAAASQEQILEKMRLILAAMQSSENFQEAVNRLLEIRRIEQNLRRDLERPGEKPDDLFDRRQGGG